MKKRRRQTNTDIIVEAMMVGLSVMGASNTTYSGRFTYTEHPVTVPTVANHYYQDQTRDDIGGWGRRMIGNNYHKLLSFAALKQGWDGYNAEVIPEGAIFKTFGLLSKLNYYPNLFPTGRGSVQIERYINDDTFVEVEVFADTISVYSEGVQGVIEEDNVTEERACELLEAIYGREG